MVYLQRAPRHDKGRSNEHPLKRDPLHEKGLGHRRSSSLNNLKTLFRSPIIKQSHNSRRSSEALSEEIGLAVDQHGNSKAIRTKVYGRSPSVDSDTRNASDDEHRASQTTQPTTPTPSSPRDHARRNSLDSHSVVSSLSADESKGVLEGLQIENKEDQAPPPPVADVSIPSWGADDSESTDSFIDRRHSSSGSGRSIGTGSRSGKSSPSRKFSQNSSRGPIFRTSISPPVVLPTEKKSDKRLGLIFPKKPSFDGHLTSYGPSPRPTSSAGAMPSVRLPKPSLNRNRSSPADLSTTISSTGSSSAPQQHRTRDTHGKSSRGYPPLHHPHGGSHRSILSGSSGFSPHHAISEIGHAMNHPGDSISPCSSFCSPKPDSVLLGNRPQRSMRSRPNVSSQISVGSMVGVSALNEESFDEPGPSLTESEMEFNGENRDFWGDYNFGKKNAVKEEFKYVVQKYAAPFKKMPLPRQRTNSEDSTKVVLKRASGLLT